MHRYITYFEIAAFVASLLAWPEIRKSRYLRLYPLLLFVVVSVEVYNTFLRTTGSNYINSNIYNLQVPLQHLLYLSILYFAMQVPVHRLYVRIAIVGVIIITTVTLLYFVQPGQFNVIEYCAGSVFIIIAILMKFYEMLQNPADFNFLRIPFFYMLFAFLLFNVGTLPYFATGNWLASVVGYKGVVKLMANGMSVLNYILYTTYTLAFIWIILKKDSCS